VKQSHRRKSGTINGRRVGILLRYGPHTPEEQSKVGKKLGSLSSDQASALLMHDSKQAHRLGIPHPAKSCFWEGLIMRIVRDYTGSHGRTLLWRIVLV
jgi:hypothetical protein